MKNLKAISPLISAVLLIAIIFSMAAVISPWIYNLSTDVANDTTSNIENQITCQGVSYDFDTNYQTNGVDYNFSSSVDSLEVKIVNTGTINLHTFSLEIEFNSTDNGLEIIYLDVNSSYQKTEAIPLKPGQSTILKSNLTQNLNGTLKEVKIMNEVCPSNFVKQRL